jgi:hypothetical protein
VRNAVREFGARVWEEMDFAREARDAQAMRDELRRPRGVRVPRVVPALARHARARARVHARRAHRPAAGARGARHARRRGARARVIELYMHMMLVDGFFHADPHPGNLLVQDDGTIVVLDFGMVVRVAARCAARSRAPRSPASAATSTGWSTASTRSACRGAAPTARRARALVETLLEIAHTPRPRRSTACSSSPTA